MINNKKLSLFVKIFCLWLFISVLIFIFGYLFPPHSVSSALGRIKGGIFWWSLTILNGISFSVLQRLLNLRVIHNLIISTIVTSLFVGTISVLIVSLPATICRINNYFINHSRIYVYFNKLLNKMRTLGSETNEKNDDK
jgi:hypothetical protein